MSEDGRALVYRGPVWGGRRRQEDICAAANPAALRIGVWDVSLVLGDLPEVLKDATPQWFTVTAPVPAGVVGPGPRLVVERLTPHALRVAHGLRLDWLIALTPFRLAAPGRRVYADGPVLIVSMADEGKRMIPARRALAAAREALPPEARSYLGKAASRRRS